MNNFFYLYFLARYYYKTSQWAKSYVYSDEISYNNLDKYLIVDIKYKYRIFD